MMNSALRTLCAVHLGQDWDIFGSTPDEAEIAFRAESSPARVAQAASGLESLIATQLSDEELYQLWVMELGSGITPADGQTWHDFLTHILDVLRTESGRGGPGQAASSPAR